MARSSQITILKVRNHPHLAFLPCKNANFSPGNPNRCGRGLGREKYVKGEGKFVRSAGVGYLIDDYSKTKQVFGGGEKVTFEEIVEMMMKADVERGYQHDSNIQHKIRKVLSTIEP